MNKKSFFLGVATGAVLTFAGLFVIGLVNQNSAANDPVHYLEQPVSYENKKEASFKVFQVLGNAALANALGNSMSIDTITIGFYNGNTVYLRGKNFYTDQVVTVKNPQRIGTYNYTNKADRPMTVPVIDGVME